MFGIISSGVMKNTIAIMEIEMIGWLNISKNELNKLKMVLWLKYGNQDHVYKMKQDGTGEISKNAVIKIMAIKQAMGFNGNGLKQLMIIFFS